MESTVRASSAHHEERASHCEITPSSGCIRVRVEGADLKSGRVIAIDYPADCSCSEFQTDYWAVSQFVAQQTQPFGLVHDCRVIERVSLDQRAALADARAIARQGLVTRVAIVLNVSPMMASVLRTALWLSPVRPVQLFDCVEQAYEWAAKRD